MGCVGVLLLGLVSFNGLAVDLLPDVATPRITLVTDAEALALAPQEVERLITKPIEEAVATVSGVTRQISVSREGMSVVTAEFPWGIDLDLTALHVREAVDKARDRLPEEIERPAVLRWDPGSEPTMGVAVAGGGSLGALREMVEQVVVPRLEQVVGIAGAQVTGGAQREVHVTLDPDLLALYGLTIADVERSLQQSNSSLRGGNVLQGALRYSVQALGEYRTLDEIGETIIGTDPTKRRVRLRDVGRVDDGVRPRTAGALLNGQQAIGVLVYKEAGANTIDAVAAAETALSELRAQYPELAIEVAFENASFISQAIDPVVQNMAIGGIFAFAVLFMFLRDPRNPILIGVAIPISIIATFVLCYFAGITLNIMTLGGLALGAGLLVDNSIVVIENIFRHRQGGASAAEASARGAQEVAMPVTAATVTTVAVFLPIAYVHGVAGELFSAQAWTVTFSLVASLLVSLTVLPTLTARSLQLGSADLQFDGATASAAAGGDHGAAGAPGGATAAAAANSAERGPDGGDSKGNADLASETALDRDLDRLSLPLRNRVWDRVKAAPGTTWRAARSTKRLPGAILDTVLMVFLFWVKLAMRAANWIVAPLLDGFATIYAGFVRVYHSALMWCLAHKTITLVGVALLMAWGTTVARSLPWELMPRVNTGRFEVTLDAPPGTPFERLEEIVRGLEAAAHDAAGVGVTFSTIGADSSAVAASAAAGAMALSPTRAQITVVMDGDRSRRGLAEAEAAMDMVRRYSESLADIQVTIDPQQSPLQRLLGFGSAGFQVLVRGDELSVLQTLADQVAADLSAIDGMVDIDSRTAQGNPEIRLRVLRDVASRYGVSVEDVTQALQAALQGTIPTQLVEFDRRIDIRVIAASDASSVEALLNQPYQTQLGPVPL